MINILNDLIWNKAIEMVKEKYGKNLTYRAIKLVGDIGQEEAKSYYISGDDLVIPLKNKDSNLGDVIVSRGIYLNAEEKTEVANVIKLLIEPQLGNLQTRQDDTTSVEKSPNIISLNYKQKTLSSLHLEDRQRKETLSQVLLLKSHTEMSRTKVALKIHEMTQRNLFVRIEDIMGSIETAEDFKNLEDVTIYIENIEQLSTTSINKVQEYLEMNYKMGPLFLIGSTLSPEAIMATDWKTSFQNDLLGFYFDIDRVPLAQQTSSEILELLFFQLDTVLT